MKKILLTLFVGLAFGSFAYASGSQEPTEKNTMKSDDMAMKPAAAPFYDLSGLGRQVVPFTTEATARELAKTETVVYFFAASWCPTCQAAYKDLRANFSLIPNNVTLIVVNYDKASALKQEYGITVQHTYVEINATGAKVKVWSGSTTVADILSNAKV